MTKLKAIRTAAGLSQKQLAENAGVNARMVQHYEQGFKDINKAQVMIVYKLAQALGCSVEDLIEIEKAL